MYNVSVAQSTVVKKLIDKLLNKKRRSRPKFKNVIPSSTIKSDSILFKLFVLAEFIGTPGWTNLRRIRV